MKKQFLNYYKINRKLLAIVLFCVILTSSIELLIPIATRQILNHEILQLNFNGIIRIGIILLILLIFYFFSSYGTTYLGHQWGISIETIMREKGFKKLQNLGLDFYDANKTGQILARMTTDLHYITELLHHGAEELFSFTILTIIGFLYLFSINAFLALILLLLLTIMCLVTYKLRFFLMAGFSKMRHENGEINAKLENAIAGIRLTKLFTNEAYEISQFKVSNNYFFKIYMMAYKRLALSMSMNKSFIHLTSIIILILGSLLVASNKMTIGDLTTFFIFTQVFLGPIKTILGLLENFQQGWTSFVRFQEILEYSPNIKEAKNPVALEKVTGSIVFKDVTFKYANDLNPVLKHFNLTFTPFSITALVGQTGVGKTTIAQLIARLYDISEGDILIDGIDIKQISIATLRSHIGFVSQDPFIFYGTIKDNIRYGNLLASDDEIINAAKSAHIHDFIMSLDEGYDTMCTEKGTQLSGGQKQRIAIARIFLRDPKILILDEATSALDNITESIIQENIEQLAKNRTLIIIAHRLSTIKKASNIVVLDSKGVVQSGTHEVLIKQKGLYQDLWNSAVEKTATI